MADRPHFAFPFSRGANGKVNVVEQDLLEHVDACCQVIVRCPAGFRSERPEFGWQAPVFAGAPVDTSAAVAAIKRFEPRVADVRAREWAETAASAERHISLDVGVN